MSRRAEGAGRAVPVGRREEAPVVDPEVLPDETIPGTEEPPGEGEAEPDLPWVVIVWNDPVNLMSYVVFVFQKLFGYSKQRATELMLDVHHEGKAAVSEGAREQAEADVARLHAHGLWATMEKSGGSGD